MTDWRVVHGDILDVAADALLCSANPSLNLSGGVGGAFLVRYGDEMQSFLREELRRRNVRHVPRGEVVLAPPCGSPYRAVVHAVAVDAIYDTSASIILETYRRAIETLANADCRTIAAACIGCGYGRFGVADFAEAVRPLLACDLETIDEFTFVTTNGDLVASLQEVVARGLD